MTQKTLILSLRRLARPLISLLAHSFTCFCPYCVLCCCLLFTEPWQWARYPEETVQGAVAVSGTCIHASCSRLFCSDCSASLTLFVSFRVQLEEEGTYECSLTGLVFEASERVLVRYSVLSWSKFGAFLHDSWKFAGPIFNVDTVNKDASVLKSIQFPHSICLARKLVGHPPSTFTLWMKQDFWLGTTIWNVVFSVLYHRYWQWHDIQRPAHKGQPSSHRAHSGSLREPR